MSEFEKLTDAALESAVGENRDQQKLTKEELEQVTGGRNPLRLSCYHNCNDCDDKGCPVRTMDIGDR